MFDKLKVYSFAKAQLSAFTGGLVDYAVMLVCTEIFKVHYTISIAIGGVIGAALNFTLNRFWTFIPPSGDFQIPLKRQLLRFIPVVCGSILFKSSGTFLLTNLTKVDYRISRIIVEILVSLGFNYLLQKKWVFKHKSD